MISRPHPTMEGNVATIDIRYPHNGDPQALDKMRALLEEFTTKRAELVKDVKWASDGQSAIVNGKGFKGDFRVEASAVTIAIDLNMLTRAFKGRIESELQTRLDAAFS